jgi:flagellar hook-associated protein 2
MDTDTLITQLVALRSQGLNRMQQQQKTLQSKQSAYATLGTKLTALKAKADVLSKSSTFDAKKATVSAPAVMSASTDANAVSGMYDVTIVQRSTASRLTGAGNVSSTAPLDLSQKLESAALNTAITGESGGTTGSFTVNGTTINYDTSSNTVADILARINNSNAGVTAMYDKTGDRFVLTNTNGGAAPVTVADVGGNFLAATGLTGAGATSQVGQQAKIQIGGFSSVISSNDDIFTAAETGLPGLSLTLNQDSGTAKVTVGVDTAAVQTAFTDFATAYNDVVQYIADQSKVTGTGTTAQVGLFTGDQVVRDVSNQLREMMGGAVSGQPDGYGSLQSIGFGTTGTSPTVSVFDSTKLANAVTNNPDALKTLVTDASNGIIKNLDAYVNTQLTSPTGFVMSKNDTTTSALDRLDVSIKRETTNISNYEANLRKQYAAMETAMNAYQGGLSQLLSSLGQTTQSSG